MGSTEQGEYYAEKYQRNVVAYLNLDDAVSGKHFKLSASPVLDEVLLAVAKELEYPEKGPVVCMTTGWPMVVESNLLGLGPIIQFTLTISEFPQWTWVLLVGKVTQYIIIIPTTTLTTG